MSSTRKQRMEETEEDARRMICECGGKVGFVPSLFGAALDCDRCGVFARVVESIETQDPFTESLAKRMNETRNEIMARGFQ